MSPAELARKTGINRKSMYKYLEGKVANPRGTVLLRIAGALDMEEEALRFGARARRGLKPRRIPVMPLSVFGTLRKGRDPLDVWNGIDTEAVGDDCKDGDFIVTLEDDSNAPLFNEGERVICNKEAPIVPGCYVVVTLEKLKASVFRRYRPMGLGDKAPFKLVANNPDYPEIEVGPDNPGFVVARAIKHIRDI